MHQATQAAQKLELVQAAHLMLCHRLLNVQGPNSFVLVAGHRRLHLWPQQAQRGSA